MVWGLVRLLSKIPLHMVFAVIAGVNAALLIVLNPPFQVHDEFQHFLRSYELSEGEIWAVQDGGRTGSVFPSSVPEFIQRTWGTLVIHEIPPLGQHRFSAAIGELSHPLAPERRTFVDFSGAAPYSPLPYLPQTAAISLGRLFQAPPIVLLFLGRLFNAVASIATITWALKILPVGRLLALVIALLPISQYEYASVAPDAAIIASAFLFTAIVLRADVYGRWAVKDIFKLVVTGVVFCSIKIVYAPLLLAGLVASSGGGGRDPAKRIIAYGLIIILVTAMSIAWLFSTPFRSLADPGASGGSQVAYVLTHPVTVLFRLAKDLTVNGLWYFIDGVGVLGAFTVYLPIYAYVVAEVSIVLACLCPYLDQGKLGRAATAWNMFLLASSVILIELAMYVLGSPTGSRIVYGVQGRYFLPLGALGAATLVSMIWLRREPPARPYIYSAVVLLLIFNTIVMDLAIVYGFGLF
jgi:uncharacterized membrane protein